MGGAGWGPLAKIFYCPAWQVEVGYFGSVPIKSIEVVLEILLGGGQLHKLALVSCFLRILEAVIVVLVHWLILVG